ncbi:hypothetical protein JOL62DRAFT_104969 [Phyllosticta paracitricarpa]|uniref:CUE domain-containing protein n=1 Tax=Phyllosticta paracitricarpa TaxID=2016321 RepID=A0ABR1N5X2_9PEZI
MSENASTTSSSTFNIPQLLVIAVVSFLLFRWYSSSSGSASTTANGRSTSHNNGAPRVNPAAVEQVALMFPQLQRRDIMWDLSRNGSNVAATTERILSGRGLDVPPPSYQPPMPAPRTAASTPLLPKSQNPDLITRYNLANKINNDESGAAEDGAQNTTWSQNKSERQKILQKRREEMVLAARRRMLEKDKASGGSSTGGAPIASSSSSS